MEDETWVDRKINWSARRRSLKARSPATPTGKTRARFRTPKGKVEKTAEDAVDSAKGAAQAVGDKLADR